MKKIVLLFLVLTSLMIMSFTESISTNSEKSYSDLSQLNSFGEGEIFISTEITENKGASFINTELYKVLKSGQNAIGFDSLKTDIYIVREEENNCPVIYVVVIKTVNQTDFAYAFGEMTVGEGCSNQEFFSEIDVKGKSPNNLAETIESNMDVSYAIKRWYFDHVLQKGR